MNVIRMIKLFGWEPKVKQEIDEKRSEELVWIKRRQYLDIVNGCVKYVVPEYPSANALLIVEPSYIIPLLTMIITYFTYVGYRCYRQGCLILQQFADGHNEEAIDWYVNWMIIN